VIEAPKISLRASASGVEYSDGIVSRTTGVHLRHAAAHPHKGAASISAQLPGRPQGELKTLERFAFAAASGKARESVRYGIKNARGETKADGATDGSGATEIVTDRLTDQLRVSVGVEPTDEAVAPEAVVEAAEPQEEYPEGVAEVFDEQAELVSPPIEGIPYHIETKDGRKFSGRVGADGRLPRISTEGEEAFDIFWGDEALARIEGEQ
jgi:uncharacterized protein (DUF2345 family)